MTAVTAVTIQNTKGVKSVIPISSKEMRNQIIFLPKISDQMQSKLVC